MHLLLYAKLVVLGKLGKCSSKKIHKRLFLSIKACHFLDYRDRKGNVSSRHALQNGAVRIIPKAVGKYFFPTAFWAKVKILVLMESDKNIVLCKGGHLAGEC